VAEAHDKTSLLWNVTMDTAAYSTSSTSG